MRHRRIAGLFFFLLGLAPLFNALSHPRVQALHVPEILQLVAVGLLFGAGLGLLIRRA